MTSITLYHNGPSTCSQKVRLILELKKLDYESKTIDLMSGEQHDPEYIKLNPNHVVPTLVVNNMALVESSLINEYLEDTFPEIKARPKDPLSIHKMRLWIKYIDSYHPQCGAITYGIGVRNILLQRTKEEIDKEVANIPDVTKRLNRIDLLEKGLKSPVVIEGIKQSKIFLDKLEDELPYLGITTPWVQPFPLLKMEDHPERQLIRASNYISAIPKVKPIPLPAKPKTPSRKIRIGYFSADFNDHPVSHQISKVFCFVQD